MENEAEVPTTGEPQALLATLAADLRRLATDETTDDVRLARLALRTEEAAARARSDPRTLFAEVKSALPGDLRPLRRAMKHLTSLAEEDFFRGALLLLMIETDRQLSCAVEDRSPAGAEEVLEAFTSYRFSTSFSAGRFLAPELLAWILCELSATLPKLDATLLLHGTTQAGEFLESCQGLLRAHEHLRSQDALWSVLEQWLHENESEDALGELVALLTQAGDLDRAASLVERLPDPYSCAQAGATVASALFALGRDEEALAWLRRDTEYPHVQAEALNAEVGRRINSVNLASARWIASSIEEADHRAAQLAEVALAYLSNRRPRDAVECLTAAVAAAEQCASLGPLLDTLETIADQRPHVAEVMAELDLLLERIWKLAEGVDHHRSQLRIRSALVRAWAALGNLGEARRHADQLGEPEEAPAERFGDVERVECLAAIAREIGSRSTKSSDSRKVLDRALREARQIPRGRNRCPALLAVAHGLAATGVENAAAIFYETFAAARETTADGEGHPLAQMLGNIFCCLASTPEFPERQNVFAESLVVIAELTEDWWKSRALVKAPALFTTLRQDDDAREWVKGYYQAAATVTHSAYRAEVLEEMARALARRGWLAEIPSCLEKIDGEDRATAQLRLAEELYGGHRARALPLLEAAAVIAREAARRHPTGLEENVTGTLARCALTARALDFAEGIEDPRQRSLALSGVACEALRQDDRRSAREALLRAMVRAGAPEVEITLAFDPAALTVLARALTPHDPHGHLRRQLFGVALERTTRLADPERWDDTFLTWTRLLTGTPFKGRDALLDTATSEIHHLSPEWRREPLLAEVTEALVSAGERKRALRLAETLASKFRYAKLLAAVARDEAREGQDRTAHDVLSRALEAIAATEPSSSGRPMQSGLLAAICTLADDDLREDLLGQASAPLHRIELDTRRAEALTDFGKTLTESTDGVWIAEPLNRLVRAVERAEMPMLALDLEERRIAVLARAGDVDEALASTRRIDPKHWQHPNALVRIVRELVARQWIGPAFQVFDLIHPDSSRVEALREIVTGLSSSSADERALFLKKLAGIEDVESRSELLTAWVEGFAQAALTADLQTTADCELAELERRMYHADTWDARATTLVNVVKCRALLGEIDRALEILDTADAGEMVAPALTVLAEIAAEHPDVAEKRRIFQAIRALVETFENEEAHVAGLADLAQTMARGGLVEQARDLLTEAVAACLEIRPVCSRSFVELARPLAAGVAVDDPHLVARWLALTTEIESEEEQVEALVAVAGARPRLQDLRDVDSEKISGNARRRFLTAWRQALLDCDETPLAALRATLACFPEEPGAGFAGVSCLAAALLKRGETAAYDALARNCPTAGLPPLE